MSIIEKIIEQQGADSVTVQALRQFFPVIEQAEKMVIESAERDAQAAEIERLKLRDAAAEVALREAAEVINDRSAEIARLRDLLKPFAEEAETWGSEEDSPSDATLYAYGSCGGEGDMTFTVGHLRRARAALAHPTNKESLTVEQPVSGADGIACFCDRTYPDSNPDASCGDCPTRDYQQPQPSGNAGELTQSDDYHGGDNPPNKLLYGLMAPYHLQHVTGQDLLHLLSFGRDVWRDALAAQSTQPDWHRIADERAAEIVRLDGLLAAQASGQEFEADDVREFTNIGKAVNRAAMGLPDGWNIRIELERDAGTVYLSGPGVNEAMIDGGGEPFSEQINSAIDAARAAAKTPEVNK